MSAFNGKVPYAPDYASYNWTGAPANYQLSDNSALGGDSRKSTHYLVAEQLLTVDRK